MGENLSILRLLAWGNTKSPYFIFFFRVCLEKCIFVVHSADENKNENVGVSEEVRNPMFR